MSKKSTIARTTVRPRQDVIMEYVLMVLTAACVLVGIAEVFLPGSRHNFDMPVQTAMQDHPDRCERAPDFPDLFHVVNL